MTNFTTNLSPNPSLQLGSAGYGAFNNATLTVDPTRAIFSLQSLLVQTPGEVAAEGCSTPDSTIVTTTSHSLSLYILGTGDFLVSAVVGGVIVSSVPFQPTGQWQRVVINGISASSGQLAFLSVTTSSTQQTAFWIGGIQIEPESPAHPYCDGEQIGCSWTGGVVGSTSFQPFMNPDTATSLQSQSTTVIRVLEAGEQFFTTAQSTQTERTPLIGGITDAGPVAALTDFGVALSTDPDPAESYMSWNTAAQTAATSGAGNRSWAIFYPPLDYIASANQKLWARADRVAVGFQLISVPNNGTVNMSDVQVEVLPLNSNAPSAFQPPREIVSVIKPDRLNYCTNPSIETNTTGWSAVGTATIARDSTVTVGNIIEYDDVERTTGVASLKVTLNASGDGAQITLDKLISGDTYIVSSYVRADLGLSNIVITCGGQTGSVLSASGTGYGTGTYGGGFYGGSPVGSDLAISTWYRINTIFTATDETMNVLITSVAAGDVSFPTHLWIDAVLAEAGEALSFYFDGSFGTNYMWETGGTANLARSYYYDQFAVKQQAVNNVLAKHLPLGISAATPQFAVPYTQ